MTAKRRRRASRAVTRDLMLAPAVMAMRMPTLMAEAANASLEHGPETMSAVNEKVAAFAEGVAAAQLAWMGAAMMMPFAFASARSPMAPMMDMAEAVSTAAFAPAGRQVRRNHRRLVSKA